MEYAELNSKLSFLVEQVSGIINNCETEKRKNKKGFNVLNCLTKHHLEELHTNFISYLLNIKEAHDLNETFLKLFIQTLKETIPELKQAFEKELLSDSYFFIKNNHFIGHSSVNEAEYGFIDIYLETKNYIICIENKITAEEQPCQLERYARYCSKQKDKISVVLFLNPWGYNSKQSENVAYFSISYKETIKSWLDKSISYAKDKNYTRVLHGLEFYKEIINEKILNISTSEAMSEIKNIIRREQNISLLKHWNEISNSVEDLQNDLLNEFWSELKLKLNQRFQIDAKKDLISISNNEYQFIKGKENIIFHIEMNELGIFYGLIPKLSIKSKNAKKFTEFKTSFMEKLNTEDDSDDGWILWKWLQEGYNDEFYYSLATNCNEVKDKLMNEISNYLEIWKEALKKIEL
jgi:hypothetical protein